MSNDVADREEELKMLRKRERIYLQRLASLEKAHELEETVRGQLSRRLEEILMEKQELAEIIEKAANAAA